METAYSKTRAGVPQQPDSIQKVLILAGPTASGKSALALEWAKTRNGVIINADAMQVYSDLGIITAQPTLEEQRDIPHRLYGYRDPSEACSVTQWLEAVRIAIYETWQEGKLPILVGGTGMYLKILMKGIAKIPDIDAEIREAVRAMVTAEAYTWLTAHDPEMAVKLKPNDSQRIKRAVEVLRQTGKSLLDWQAQPMFKPIPEATFEVHILSPERAALYARCDARLLKMIEEGAIEEVKVLLRRCLAEDLPAMPSVAVPELLKYVRGEWTKEEAIVKAQQATRNYAKRQMTWLRKDRDVTWMYGDEINAEAVAKYL